MEKRHSYLRGYINHNQGYSLIFIISLMTLGCIRTGMWNLTAEDFFFLISRGFSYQKFSVAEFLYYLFFEIYPLFWINVFLEQEKKDRNIFAKFRYASMTRWNRIITRICQRYILVYYGQFVLCVVMAGFILGMICHGTNRTCFHAISQQYGISPPEIYMGLGIAFVWRWIELMILLEVDLLLFQGTKNTLAAFLGTFMVYLLGAVFRSRNILIVGLAASYGVFEITGLKQSGILIRNLLAGLILAVLLFVIQKKMACRADR